MHGSRVTLVDAYHCPGAAMFVIVNSAGVRFLHTGDFRLKRTAPQTEHEALAAGQFDTVGTSRRAPYTCVPARLCVPTCAIA